MKKIGTLLFIGMWMKTILVHPYMRKFEFEKFGTLLYYCEPAELISRE